MTDAALIRLVRMAASTWFNAEEQRWIEELIKRFKALSDKEKREPATGPPPAASDKTPPP